MWCPVHWWPTSAPRVVFRLTAHRLQVYNKTPSVLLLLLWFHNYLQWSIKFKYHFKGIPFMPLIWKFLVFLCWAEVGRWGGSLDFMHGSRPEVCSGVVSSPSIASGQNGWKPFKTFSPILSNHKPQVHCWPAAYNWILLFESKTKINTSHQW